MENKLYCSKQLVQAYFEIVETLKEKHSVIVLGNCSTGKSTLIKLLEGGADDKSASKDVKDNSLSKEMNISQDHNISKDQTHV